MTYTPKLVGKKFRPSSADRYLNCPASVVAASDLPRDEGGTVYSDAGNVAHALGEHCIITGDAPESKLGEQLCIGRGIETPVDQAMIDGVKVYIDWHKDQAFTDFEVEEKVSLPWIKNEGGEKTIGYIDLKGYSADFDELTIADYKNGGKPVPDSSLQFAVYALALMDKKIYKHLKTIRTVRVQPNVRYGSMIGHHDWERGELIRLKAKINFAVDWVNKTKREDLKDADFCEGDHCAFCPAASANRCPAKLKSLFDVIGEDAEPPVPSALSPEKIALIMKKRVEIKSWLDDVHSYYTKEAVNGNVLDGFKLVEGRSKPRGYQRGLEDDEIIKGLQEAGVDYGSCIQPPKPITPAKARKIDGINYKILESILKPAEKNIELAPAEDERLSVDGSDFFN